MSLIETKTTSNGSRVWLKDGQPHREDGPAVITATGAKGWYIDGKKHRDSGPAIEDATGTKFWYLHGVWHREDGPAAEYPDGKKEWARNGQRHREDGPAVINADGTEEWWMNDTRLGPKEIASLKFRIAAKALRPDVPLVLASFHGTLNPVAAPEKEAFKKHTDRKRAGVGP